MTDWSKLPVIRNDGLIFTDTSVTPGVGAIVPCLICTKPFVMGVFIGNPDQICGECANTYKDAAKVICRGCYDRPVICRLNPSKLDNGFTIWPRAILHVDHCNICMPNIKTSTVLEIAEWERTQRRPRIIMSPR